MARQKSQGKAPVTGARPDPAKVPLWDIARTMTTTQVVGVLAFLAGMFAAGYSVSEWVSGNKLQATVNDLNEAHRADLVSKDTALKSNQEEISQLKATINTNQDDLRRISENLEKSKAETKQIAYDSAEVIRNAATKAHAFQAKAEFLNRFLYYEQSHNEVMFKLFVDHVCVLWRNNQRDILETRTERFSIDDIEGNRPLDKNTELALNAVGIDSNTIEEYVALSRNRSQIQPTTKRVTRVGPFFHQTTPEPNPQFERLQTLDRKFQSATQKIPSRKTVTFFDNTTYEVPPEVATAVHLRADCQP